MKKSRIVHWSMSTGVFLFGVIVCVSVPGQEKSGAPAPSGLEVSFLPASVRVTGVTRAGQVAILAVSQERFREYYSEVGRRAEVVTDTDGDGVIEIASAPAVPPRSIWIVIDITTGDATAATPTGYPTRIGAGDEPYRAPSGHGLTKIRNARSGAELLLVRRRSGAWTARVYTGSLRDENRNIDGASQIDVSSMQPLAGSPPAPERLIGSDVLAMIDPLEMEFWVAKVGAAQ